MGRDRPKRGTLVRLVERRTDLTPDDLEKFYEKHCDLYAAVWVLLAGLVLGGGSVGLIELIKEGSTVPAFLGGIGILAYNIVFWFAVCLVFAGLGIVGYFVVRYNPLSAHELFIDDYLSARAILAEKTKPSEPSEEKVAQGKPKLKTQSEYAEFLLETLAVFIGVGLAQVLGTLPIILGVLLPAIVGYLMALILLKEFAIPLVKKETGDRLTRKVGRLTAGIAWLARKSATFVVGAGLELLLVTENPGGFVLFAILASVGVIFVWESMLLKKILPV